MFQKTGEVLQRTQWHEESKEMLCRTWQHGIVLKWET